MNWSGKCFRCGQEMTTGGCVSPACQGESTRFSGENVVRVQKIEGLDLAGRIADLERQLVYEKAKNAQLEAIEKRLRDLELWRHAEETLQLEQNERN